MTRVRNTPRVCRVILREKTNSTESGRPTSRWSRINALEYGAPGLRPVEDARVGDLELAEGEVVDVASSQVLTRER